MKKNFVTVTWLVASLIYMSLVVRKQFFFALNKNKDADQLCGDRQVTAQLISAFVFATQIGQSLYFFNTKVKASSHLLLLYSPVCVGPGQKPQRPVFSQHSSYASGPEVNASMLEIFLPAVLLIQEGQDII